MKNISKFAILLLILTTLVWSCDKDENKINFEGGTAPVLTANKTAISLSFLTKAKEAVTFSWTNPNYQFTTGISSQNVSYILEIDTTGANFTNPNKKAVALSTDLSFSIPDSTFNDYLLNTMALIPAKSHNLDVRIMSTLTNSSVPLYSNVLNYTVTPYAIPPKVVPPTAGTLWIIGNAVAGEWDNPIPAPYDVTQKFTRESETLYTLIVPMIAGASNGYKLIQTQGNWDTQYHALDGTIFTGGDFELKNSDPQFPAPAASGIYKITIDFQRGKYTVVAQ
ncbi:MAG TPA: SusE domain-containing protein [Prolixibacteraceae bacterium]|nr:SusE domain-containing protein [Prolixibacteraceae bacterium]